MCPFYFTPFSIMMYNIHTGYNVRHVSDEEILILVSSLARMAELRIPFVFTGSTRLYRDGELLHGSAQPGGDRLGPVEPQRFPA